MNEATPTDSPEKPDDGAGIRLPLIVILLIAAFLRFYQLGVDPFWRDEGTAYLVATLPWQKMWDVLLHERANMVFFFLLIRFWEHVGSGEATLRLLSVIPGILSVLLVYLLGSRWFDRRTGLYAALTLSLSALHVQYSQELRGYAMMLMLLLMSAIFLDRAVKEGQLRFWAGHVITSALAFYCSTTALLLVIPIWVSFPLLYPGWRAHARRFIVAAFSFVILISPMLYVVSRNDVRILTGFGSLGTWNVRQLVLQFVYGRALLTFFAVVGIVAFMHVVQKRPKWRELVAMIILLSVPFFAILALSFVKTLSSGRYLIAAWIPLSILVGFSLSRLGRRWLRGVAVVALIVLSARTIDAYYKVHKTDWRGATRYALEQAKPGDGAVFFTTQGSHSFLYYARETPDAIEILVPADSAWWTLEMDPDPSAIAETVRDHRRVWLFLSATQHHMRRPKELEIQRALEPDFARVAQRDFYGVDAILYEKR